MLVTQSGGAVGGSDDQEAQSEWLLVLAMIVKLSRGDVEDGGRSSGGGIDSGGDGDCSLSQWW